MQKLKLFFIISATLFCQVLFFAYGAESVDINSASLEQLDTLTGIGPALGQRIIDNRPYTSIDDLLKVQGIGPKNLEKIKQQGIATTSVRHMSDTSLTPYSTTSQIPEQVVKTSPPPSYPNNIFLSEILPSPEGSDTENEFIEIFNANNFEVDISGFKIRDRIGTVKTFAIPENTKILANSFLTFKSSQTKISLNNAGDGMELLDPLGKIIDSTDFSKSQPGQSWSKIENIWAWTAKPTPNQENIFVSTQATSTSSVQATSSPLITNINNYPPQKKNFLAVGIATVIALSSALIAWRIKKNSIEI